MPVPSDTTDATPRRDLHLELTPFLNGLVDIVRESGIPIEPIHRATAGHLIGVSASFKVSENLPAINFLAREHAPELFGAFSPAQRSVSWSVLWPLHQFTFRLQGGKDSEVHSLAIGGVEWNHPSKPLAIGVGMPVSLHGGGHVAGIMVLRVKF